MIRGGQKGASASLKHEVLVHVYRLKPLCSCITSFNRPQLLEVYLRTRESSSKNSRDCLADDISGQNLRNTHCCTYCIYLHYLYGNKTPPSLLESSLRLARGNGGWNGAATSATRLCTMLAVMYQHISTA